MDCIIGIVRKCALLYSKMDEATLERLRQNDPRLTTLWLGYNKIGPEGAVALARALEKNAALTKLFLSGNNIGNEGAAALANALEKNDTLTRLDLGYNSIGDEEAAVLAKALEKNHTLTRLDLISNNIGPEGAAALAMALEKNTVLTTLYLRFNNIGSEGAAALAMALEKNATLTALEVEENNIGPEGAAALAKALENNGMLTRFGPETPEIKRYLERNKRAHAKARKAVLYLIAIAKFRIRGGVGGELAIFPKDMLRMIAKQTWATRGESVWWDEPKETTSKKQRVQSCIQCRSARAHYMEEGSAERAFCGIACQGAFYETVQRIGDGGLTDIERLYGLAEPLKKWELDEAERSKEFLDIVGDEERDGEVERMRREINKIKQ